MDADQFDRLVTAFVTSGSRRRLLRLLPALPVFASLTARLAEPSQAATRRRQPVHDAKKKKRKCAQAGQPTTKKRKRCCPGLVKRSKVCTRPSPPPSPPPPPPATCQCRGNQVCHNGVCQPCDVTCTGTATACGTALQAALSGSQPTIYVCPGRYQPPSADGFIVNKTKTVIGAGQGQGSATNTILDANQQGRVVAVALGTADTVVLEQLRITDGVMGSDGGGISHQSGTLRMTDCSVIGNTSNDFGGGIVSFGPNNALEMTRCTVANNRVTGGGHNAGGIFLFTGSLTLTDCVVEDNTAGVAGGGILIETGSATLNGTTQVKDNTAPLGGGIFAEGGGTLTIAASCRVTNNTATTANGGGGINNGGATVILQGATPSPIVVNNCHDNCGGRGAVPKCAAAPISC